MPSGTRSPTRSSELDPARRCPLRVRALDRSSRTPVRRSADPARAYRADGFTCEATGIRRSREFRRRAGGRIGVQESVRSPPPLRWASPKGGVIFPLGAGGPRTRAEGGVSNPRVLWAKPMAWPRMVGFDVNPVTASSFTYQDREVRQIGQAILKC